MNKDSIYEKDWYVYLKNKYKLKDNDMDEYIDSFDSINRGNPITISVLQDFIYNEINEKWSKDDCRRTIKRINLDTNKKDDTIINLKTFLFYIIPICQNYIINRISTKDLFDKLDKDGDGKITCNELTNVIYLVNKQFTVEEVKNYKEKIRKICDQIDIDDNGEITFEEFVKFLIRVEII